MTTRDRPGRLDEMLVGAGAVVVHMPLIEFGEPSDGGSGLADALRRLHDVDWLLVTSVHGASIVGAGASAHPNVRLAAVGTRSAAALSALAARRVDVVPNIQTAAHLVEAMPADGSGLRVLVAQADRALSTLADGLTERGYSVEVVTAYSTHLRTPTLEERKSAVECDAVAFASGSAAEAWAAAIGPSTPPVVVAIGPVTASVASAANITVTDIAAVHTVDGLFAAIVEALGSIA